MFNLQKCRHWLAAIKAGDPFGDLVKAMCLVRLLPYENAAQAKKHRVSPKRVQQMHALCGIKLLAIARFLGIVFLNQPLLRFYLFEYLSYEKNQKQFFLALSALLGCPMIMYFQSLFILCQKRCYMGVVLKMQLSQVQDKGRLAVVRLCNNIILRVSCIWVPIFTLIIFVFILFDTYWSHMDRIGWINAIIWFAWTLSLLAEVFSVSSFANCWMQSFVMIITCLNKQMIALENRVAIITRFEKLHPKLRLVEATGMVRRLLVDVEKVVRVAKHYSDQNSLFLFIFHFMISMALNAMLFLVVDHRTQPFLRWLSIIIFTFGATIVIVVYLFFASLNRASKRIVPVLNILLYRHHLSEHLQLKLCSVRDRLVYDHVGLTSGHIFTFTKLKVIIFSTGFVTNFILIVGLFESFFSGKADTESM